MLYDNQINGNEKCEDELADGTDRRTLWENNFLLSRQ